MSKRWTDKEVEVLKWMAQRYPVPKIAERMDRTVGGVTFKAYKLKLSLRPARDGSAQLSIGDPGPAGFDW